MWTCTKCGRVFKRTNQQHSCKSIPIEQHFENNLLAKDLFDFLLKKIRTQIGKCSIISLPCCIHLYGSYDFLAILPHKDRLEIRFASNNLINSPRITHTVPLSKNLSKTCIDIKNTEEIDAELLNWLSISYLLK